MGLGAWFLFGILRGWQPEIPQTMELKNNRKRKNPGESKGKGKNPAVSRNTSKDMVDFVNCHVSDIAKDIVNFQT